MFFIMQHNKHQIKKPFVKNEGLFYFPFALCKMRNHA